MSLLEPTKKMSKSLGQGHVIELADGPDTIEKKLKKAVTDSGEGKSPGVENLFLLLKNFGEKEIYEQFLAVNNKGGLQYGDLKKAVSDAIAMYFGEFREKRAMLLSEPEKLKDLLDLGARKAKATAEKTMKDVRRLVGLR